MKRTQKLLSLLLALIMVFSLLPAGVLAAETGTYTSDYDVRALFVDCARKYFSVDWFQKTIDEMAKNHMNTLFMSFSNDEGFRFLLDDMSVSFTNYKGETVAYDSDYVKPIGGNPGSVAEGSVLAKRNADDSTALSLKVANYDNAGCLTQSAMTQIIQYAKQKGISVIPEFNGPGHMGQLLWYFPQYRETGKWWSGKYGDQPFYSLDVGNPDAVAFAHALIQKYVDYFSQQGCPGFAVGGDEYANSGGHDNEEIAAYTNSLINYVQKKGMTAYCWNDGQTVTSGQIDPDAVILCWDNVPTNVKNKLINFNSQKLYYVLKGYSWKPSVEGLSGWNPTVFCDDQTIEDTSRVLGASLAVWCDDPNRETTEQVFTGITGLFPAFSQAMASESGSNVTNPDTSTETNVYERWNGDGSTPLPEGVYLIVCDSTCAMNNTPANNGTHEPATGLAYDTITVDGNIASCGAESSGHDHTNHEWTFTQNSNGTYHISVGENSYLQIPGNRHVCTGTEPHAFAVAIRNGEVLLTDIVTNKQLNFYKNENRIFSQWNGEFDDPNNRMTLYKKTVGLFTAGLSAAVDEAAALITAGNETGRYNPALFQDLTLQLEASRTVLTEALQSPDTVTQQQVNGAAEALHAAIQRLLLSDTQLNYIELPVEILDFRADGMLFEYQQGAKGSGAYEMLKDDQVPENLLGPDESSVTLPGRLGDRITDDPWLGWGSSGFKRTGLVENVLAPDGHPVYKPETVLYIAALIHGGYRTDLSAGVTNWNSTISAKAAQVADSYGTWEETLTKVGGVNGTQMRWDQIETCFDLAYYMLNNMWRPTAGYDGDDQYNMEAAGNTTLRMKLHENYYQFDSSKAIAYTDGYIYNTDLTSDNPAATKFNPLAGAGYEAADKFGDSTDIGNGINYHFTLHTYGSFIYNSADNLYFYFDGDDDVYFYINGQLVMDIGGAHAHCDDEIYLNTVAAELGLVEGGIYSFDMFYAERHSTQSNLAFRTNIKIMDTKSLTTKYQYDADSTAQNPTIANGGAVAVDTTVAYGFGLLNTRSVPVFDIRFTDDALGTDLNKTNITLYASTCVNGAVTSISDIVVYYRTYDRPEGDLNGQGQINQEVFQTKTAAEISSMIREANQPGAADPSRSIPKGSYKILIGNEADLKSLLELGLPVDCQMVVAGVKRKVVNEDRPFVNTVESRAYYYSNGNTIAINGTASQKLIALSSYGLVGPLQYVVDYGIPMDVPKTEIGAALTPAVGCAKTFSGISFSMTHGIHLNTPIGLLSETGEYSGASMDQGKITLSAENITFTPTEMFSKIQRVSAVYSVEDSLASDTSYVAVGLEFIPASSIYYEDSFVDFSETGWQVVGSENTSARQAAEQVGKENHNVYGYDGAYSAYTTYSLGSAMKATANADTTPTATFTFTGTAFDIISLTSSTTGTILVDVYQGTQATGTACEKWIVDTYYGMTRTQNGYLKRTWNKGTDELWHVSTEVIDEKPNGGAEVLPNDMSGSDTYVVYEPNYTWAPSATTVDNALYQVPVIKSPTLSYGTYTVVVTVKYSPYLNHNAASEAYDFYLDAVRIYDPAGREGLSETIHNAYQADGELNPTYIELRDLLLSANTFNNGGGTTDGIVFIDGNVETPTVSDYRNYGPNNEVYLKKNQSIAFKMISSAPDPNIQLGAKLAQGSAGTITVRGDDPSADGTTLTLATATEMYYRLSDLGITWTQDGGNYVSSPVIITNTSEGDGIVSLTNLKAPGAAIRTAPPVQTAARRSPVSAMLSAFIPMASAADAAPAYDLRIVVTPELAKQAAAVLEDQMLTDFERQEKIPYTRPVIFSAILSALQAPAAQGKTYVDISSDAWYYDYVMEATEAGLMEGSGGRFDPNGKLTRAMLVTVLYRMAGRPASAVEAPFADVDPNAWYGPAVAWACDQGIVNGVSPTAYAPHSNVTRQDMAAMMARYAQACGLQLASPDGTLFRDDPAIADYAKDSVYKMKAGGILSGRPGGEFDPTGITTRAEAAKVLTLLAKLKQ